MRLTKRSVEKLPGKADSYFVWDADLKGFGARIYPSGKRTYVIQYRAGRRTRRMTLGQHGALTTDQARKMARQKLGDVARGADPAEERRQHQLAPSVAALCDRFLELYVEQHCKPTTVRSYRTIIRNNIKPRLGTYLVNAVTRADIAALHHDMRATPYQANRALMVLSKMFNVAEDWGMRDEGANPTRRVKKYREEEKKRYLSDAEQIRLGQALTACLRDGSETEHVVAAFKLLMLTGCRRNEIATLRWEYVTTHHLELPDSKTGRRRIPLPREAYDVLMSLPRLQGNPYVILGKTPDGHITDLERPWRRVRARAGLNDVRIHDLRHTYASVAVQSGIDPFLLKEILGHKNLTTTLRYAHLADHTVQQAAGSVASRLAGALGAGAQSGPHLQVVHGAR